MTILIDLFHYTFIDYDIIVIDIEAEVIMKTELISLKSWMKYNCDQSLSPVKQKEEAAHLLEVGVATIYRWLSSGNVFIEETGVDMNGEGGPVFIWKMEKKVES